MTTIDESGAITMDTDYAPVNATEMELNTNEGEPIKFVILRSTGMLEDWAGVLMKDTEELRQYLKENDLEKCIIASGVSEVSLAQLSYAMQSPARQLYRATMADITELLNKRFEKDDYAMRVLCNNM